MPQSLPSLMISFCSGCFAGSLNSLVVAPVELLRNRSIVDIGPNGHLTVAHQVRAIVASSERGVLGLWKGLGATRSEEHTSELQSLMRSSSAVFCWKKQKTSRNKQI